MNALSDTTAAASRTILKLSALSEHYPAACEAAQRTGGWLSANRSAKSLECCPKGGSSSAFELVSTGVAERTIVLKVFDATVYGSFALAVSVAAGRTPRKVVVQIKPTSVAP